MPGAPGTGGAGGQVATTTGGAPGTTGGAPATASGGAGGQTGAGGQAGPADDVPQILAAYTSWQAMSPAPVDISTEIFSLCRGPTAAETAFIESVHGMRGLRDWANPGAVTGIAGGATSEFAVGSTIVKEKFVRAAGTGEWALASVGIMIKREPGFDPNSGNWEFIYRDPNGVISRGPFDLATCGACHSSTRATDFVFIDQSWRLKNGP